jgi:hypothetical protein
MKLWNLFAAAMSLMWFTMVSKTSMLSAQGDNFWFKAELRTRSKMAMTARSLLELDITREMALLILKWKPACILSFCNLLQMLSIMSSNWCRCCS